MHDFWWLVFIAASVITVACLAIIAPFLKSVLGIVTLIAPLIGTISGVILAYAIINDANARYFDLSLYINGWLWAFCAVFPVGFSLFCL